MTVYADTSALVKLFVDEAGTPEMRALAQSPEVIASSRIAYVELRAALAAAIRDGRIPAPLRDGLILDLEQFWDWILKVSVDEPIVRQAGDLAERMRLRGYDAVHLSALIATGLPSDVSFACWDAELRRVAGELGYRLIPS